MNSDKICEPASIANKLTRSLLSVLLVAVFLPLTVEAQFEERIAYAVSGFNDRLARLDFNLYMTTFTENEDFETTVLNHSGLYAVWGPRDDVLYFVQQVGTESHIFSIDVTKPKRKTQLTAIGGTYRFLSVSPNGKKLAFNGYTNQQRQQDNQIWILDLDTGEMETVTSISHFGRTYFFNGISWGPRSKRLVFSLERPGGLYQLYLLNIETQKIEVLTEFNIDYYPVWSPDGQNILFQRWNRDFNTLFTIDVETRAITSLFIVDKQTSMWVDYSPDGKSIIYSRWGVFYLYDIDSGKSEKLFEVDGSIFAISWWRHDVLPVEPGQKLATTWGHVKSDFR